MSPSERPTVGLIASAPPGTDILVIDSQFRLVARGARRLERMLSPGIYKVKFQAGSTVEETHVVLTPGSGPVEVRCRPLEFQSSAPLAGTRATREYHMASAADLSRQVHVTDGHGARIFVFARAWTDPAGSTGDLPFPRGQHPATALTLHDVSGRLVVDLAAAGQADLGAPDPWAGCTVELAPGPYRLRLEVPETGVLEQIVVAPAGWQAQVFVLLGNYGATGTAVYRADLASAAILLVPASGGFDPGSAGLHLAELARSALARHRVIVAHDLLNQLLGTKGESPMLGLYAAHALLAAAEPDRALLERVVHHLRAVLGSHPDVDALALHLGEPVDRAYAVPPMLRRSWTIVVEHAARRRDLVPSGSLASRAGSALWGNSAWLIWEADAAAEEEAPGLEDAVRRVEDLAARFTEETPPASAGLDDVEQAVLAYVTRRAKYRTRSRARLRREAVAEAAPSGADVDIPAAAPAPPSPADMATEMAEALGLPPSTVQTKIGGLLRKLGGS
jgi:hypothetical protein